MTTGAQVHWFTGVTELPLDDVLDVVNHAAGGYGFEVKGPKWMYERRFVSAEGLEVLADPMQEGMPPVCINAPGAACVWLGPEGVQEVASVCKPTHVDFAWDDVPFTVQEFGAALEAGNVRTRARVAERFGPIWTGKGRGNTVRLGTNGASWMLRVYDRRGPVRAELRLMGERAAQMYGVLMQDPSTWSVGFLGVLRGLVELVDRSQESRADRAPLLPSWERFVADARRVVVRIASRVSESFERASDWFHRQVAATMWAYAKAGGSVGELLRHGATVARDRHRLRARVWAAARSPVGVSV